MDATKEAPRPNVLRLKRSDIDLRLVRAFTLESTEIIDVRGMGFENPVRHDRQSDFCGFVSGGFYHNRFTIRYSVPRDRQNTFLLGSYSVWNDLKSGKDHKELISEDKDLLTAIITVAARATDSGRRYEIEAVPEMVWLLDALREFLGK